MERTYILNIRSKTQPTDIAKNQMISATEKTSIKEDRENKVKNKIMQQI